MLYYCLVLWVVGAVSPAPPNAAAPMTTPSLPRSGRLLCGALVVVLVAGIATDYLTEEVQFWLFAGLIAVFWPEPQRRKGAARPARRVRRRAPYGMKQRKHR